MNIRTIKILTLLGFSSVAFGQSEQSEVSLDGLRVESSTENIEKIEVTGSHIKQIDVEGPSPVETLNKADLEKSGFNSVADVLRETTGNSFGSQREQSGLSGSSGVATVDLRGLGPSKTLVLLNGKRLASEPGSNAIDLNTIPMSAVRKVEILKDGASAIYGSDAIGGVVNIITQKEFNGTEISINRSATRWAGGENTTVSLVTGKTFSKGSFVATVQAKQNEAIFDKDRFWSNNAVSTLGTTGSYQKLDKDGNAIGKWEVNDDCPPGQIRKTGAGDFCTYKYSDISTGLPEIRQVNAMGVFNVDVTSDVNAYGLLKAGVKQTNWQYAPEPGFLTLNKDQADKIGYTGLAADEFVRIRYRLAERGNRETENDENSYGIQVGFKGYFGESSWDWDVNTSVNAVSRKSAQQGGSITSKIYDAIDAGLFAPDGDGVNDLSGAAHIARNESESSMQMVQFTTTGELVTTPLGTISAAVGGSYNQEKFETRIDEETALGLTFSGAGSNSGGERQTGAAYAELFVPVFDVAELQVAGRYDKFSDFGDTFNPKASLKVNLGKHVMLRASAGTGFKAPDMDDLYATSTQGFPSFVDEVACAAEKAAGGDTSSCSEAQYRVTSSGNEELQEETSTSYNVGAIVQVNKRISFGADYWITNMDNVVGVSYRDITRAEQAGVNLEQYGVKVNRDTNGYIVDIVAPTLNLSKLETSGIDFAFNAGHFFNSFGDIQFNTKHSLFVNYSQEGFPGVGFENQLGRNGVPRWRNSTSLSYIPKFHQDSKLNFTFLTIGAHDKATEGEGRLKRHHRLDVQYTNNSVLGGALTIGMNNVLNRNPPTDDTLFGDQLDSALYNPRGQSAYLNYKYRF